MKTILITGSTDGIGLEAARRLLEQGHRVLLHGRSAPKLAAVRATLARDGREPVGFVADLSDLAQVAKLADEVGPLDVLVNNAGVFKVANPITSSGLDVRFVVNTLAPILLTRRLLGSIQPGGRVVNLSSAGQEPVDLDALRGATQLADFSAYAQSKLALTAWSGELGSRLGEAGPVIVAVNPGSMLATKMVMEGFGVPGRDLGIGAEIVVRAAVDPAFASASGQYYDNDAGGFGSPHPAALDAGPLLTAIDALLEHLQA